jgi:hypothetical protein
MKENREGYEQVADRTARLLAAVASAVTKANPQQLKGLEEHVMSLVSWVLNPCTTLSWSDDINQHATRDKVDR